MPAITDGTREQKREHFREPWADLTRAKAHARLRDADRREKIWFVPCRRQRPWGGRGGR